MSTVIMQRSIKRGNVRTFDEEYNRGFTDIWASELDADLEQMYALANSMLNSVYVPGPGETVVWSSIPIGAVPAGQGDLAGSYPAPTIRAGAVTGGPGGKIAANTITDYNIASVSWSKVTGAPTVPTSLPPNGPAGGALTGTYPNPGVDYNLISNKPTTPGIPAGLPPIGPAGGGLTGSYPNPGINSSAINYSAIAGAPTSFPPSGAAGGALTGSYPNPSLAGSSIGFAQLGLGVATYFILATGVQQADLGVLGHETFLAEMDWTGRGGYFLALASINGVIGSDGSMPTPGIHSLIWTGGNPGVPDGTIVGGNGVSSVISSSGISFFPYTLTTCQTARAPTGPARVKISASSIDRVVGACNVQGGWLMVAEFA